MVGVVGPGIGLAEGIAHTVKIGVVVGVVIPCAQYSNRAIGFGVGLGVGGNAGGGVAEVVGELKLIEIAGVLGGAVGQQLSNGADLRRLFRASVGAATVAVPSPLAFHRAAGV